MTGIRIVLLIASALTAFFVLHKVKKSQFKIGDTLFWLLFCLLLLLMCIFPKAVYWVSDLIGFEAPSNFIFIVIIFLLLVKMFFMSVNMAKLEDKLTKLGQKYAIDNEQNKK